MATTIPGLALASSVFFGGKWTTINGAKDLGDGWVSLDVSPYVTQAVRASAIQGIRCPNFPAVEPVAKAFDLEVL